jgi:hypothetical protein
VKQSLSLNQFSVATPGKVRRKLGIVCHNGIWIVYERTGNGEEIVLPHSPMSTEPVQRIPANSRPSVKREAVPKKVVEPWVEKLAWLMDSSIPIGRRWSIGLDGLVGLVPGVGDMAGTLVSALIIISATRAGTPRATVARMLINVAFDTILGALPVLGDVFDFAYKANTKNVKLFRESILGQRQTVRDWGFILAVALALLALLAIPLALLVYVSRLF